jgi:predicted component of type VI protein secretion system
MHKLILLTMLLGLAGVTAGCSSSPPEEKSDQAAVAKHAADNSSPAAQSAQAAPSDPSIQYPGAMKKHKTTK